MSTSAIPNLSALRGSRICHDLINPLGAIGNGVELLGLAGVGSGPEMDLLNDSVLNATSKLKFLRLAVGAATADQRVARTEILTTAFSGGQRRAAQLFMERGGQPPAP